MPHFVKFLRPSLKEMLSSRNMWPWFAVRPEVPAPLRSIVSHNRVLVLMSTPESAAPGEASVPEAPSEGSKEISLDEFEPYGTLAVTGSYFVLLLVLYALLYFVEFATHAPHIIE